MVPRVVGDRVHPPADMDGAMATVYVVTAVSGDTYRIERVYLDWHQAYGFAHDGAGMAPREPVDVEEWEVGVAVRR